MKAKNRKSKVFWIDLDEVANASFEILENLPILSEIEHKYKATRHIRTGKDFPWKIHYDKFKTPFNKICFEKKRTNFDKLTFKVM